MDKLPNELVLQVLSLVRDGPTLLDVVPLVCKRWRRLARDAAAWASAELRVRGEYATRDQLVADLRVLLHAPHLRRLELRLSDVYTHQTEEDAMKVSALRRSRATVRELRLAEGAVVCPAITDFLWCQRDALRVLDADIPEEDGEDDVVPDENGELRPPTFLGVLAKLHLLTELRLHMIDFDYLDYYDGKLAGAPLELRRLELTATQDHYGICDGNEKVMVDLLRVAVPWVRVLTVTPNASLYAEILECVERCAEVRDLGVNLLNLAVVSHMPRLHTLRLHFDAHPSQMSPENIEQSCRPLVTCAALAQLPSLRCLELHTIYKEPPEYDPVHPAAFDAFLAVAGAAINVTDARLFVTNRERLVELLGRLPKQQIQRLEMNPMGAAELEALSAFPRLEELSGRLVPWLNEAGVSCGCGPEDHAHCRDVIQAFKASRPDVRTRLEVGTNSDLWYSEELS